MAANLPDWLANHRESLHASGLPGILGHLSFPRWLGDHGLLSLHLLWAGLGTYGFARYALGLSPEAALIAALAFALSPKTLAHLGGGISAIPWSWGLNPAGMARLAWTPCPTVPHNSTGR
jgi:hypothetical protein